MTTIHAILEIGTSRTVLALGESENGGRARICCYATIPSAGVRKSQIRDIDSATQSIRGILQEIERKQSELGINVTIGNAFLVVSGQHIKVDPFTGTTQISGQRVAEDDIRSVIANSQTMTIAKDRELLDIVETGYSIDSMNGITSPLGMTGRILRLNTLHIHADRNQIENARTAASTAHLEIREPLFAATCAADAVLEDHERKNGTLVLDLGGGSTGYAAYVDGRLETAGVIGVGGEHVTNDIAIAFQTSNAQADELKRTEATAMLKPDDGTATTRVKIPGNSPLTESRTISRRALNTVVNARLRELFAMIRERLEERDLVQRLHSGAVLTGGGAYMNDIDLLARQELGMEVRIGRPIHVDGLEEADSPASLCTIAGAMTFAHHNYEEKSILGGFFGRLFK